MDSHTLYPLGRSRKEYFNLCSLVLLRNNQITRHLLKIFTSSLKQKCLFQFSLNLANEMEVIPMKLLLPHLYPGATMGLPHCILTHHAVQEVHSRPVAAPQLGSCISVHLSLACRPVTLASRLDWLGFITNLFFWKLLVPNSLDLCEHEPALLWGEPAWWCQCLL